MVKQILKRVGAAVFFYGGLFYLVRCINNLLGKRLTILTYHRVTDRKIEDIGSSLPFLYVTVSSFEQHLMFIKRHYRILTFQELSGHIQNGKLPWNSLIITFDDGYEDFYIHAYPLLKKHEIPATIFLISNKIGNNGTHPFWWDRMYYYFNKLSELETHGILPRFDLEIFTLYKEFTSDRSGLFNKLNKLETQKIEKVLDEIRDDYKIDDEELIRDNRMLDWQQISEMGGSIEIGSHSCSHYNMNELGESQKVIEIYESKNVIEDRTKKSVTVFAYPAGQCDKSLRNLVKDSAYKFAVTTERGLNRINGLYHLKRINVWELSSKFSKGEFTKSLFSAHLTGLDFHKLRRSLNKLNYNMNFKLTVNEHEGNTVKYTGEKINILFIIDNLWEISGTEKHLLYLIENLDRHIFNCSVITFDIGKSFLQNLKGNNGNIYHLPLDRIYSAKAFSIVMQIRKFIKANNIDIVQSFHYMSDTLGVFAARLSGVSRIISSRRDTGDLKKPRQVFLNKIMNRLISHYIIVCNRVGERLNVRENVPYGKMVTIYNGVNLKKYKPVGFDIVDKRKEFGINDSDFVIGTVANFRPSKAYNIFFQGVGKVFPLIKDLKVLVLGSGAIKKSFENYCELTGMKDTVKFVGHVNNVEEFLLAMDVFCLIPNKNEGFSNAILEAMAAGRPVIATNVGGNAEAVIHEETGYIIPPDDPDSFAEAIMRMYNDPLKRLEMGRNSRTRVEKHFSLEKMIRNHENLYKKVFRKR